MIFASVVDWMSFFGRFHPLAVHLPIGFLVLILLFELLSISQKIQIPVEVVSLTLLITAISASMACLLGYFLSLEGGYNEEILGEHQSQGIGLAIISWILWITHSDWFLAKISLAKYVYLPLLSFSFVLLIITGHHGGNLTHGETYLTENTPKPFRKWLDLPEKELNTNETQVKNKIVNIDEAFVYEDIVKPIFKQKCEQCHNASKMKGNLRMDEISLLQKGGKHGVIFKANNVEESEFLKRILLPESEEEHMPPKGKSQITENEFIILKWWIEQGASFDKKVSQLAQTDEIKAILSILGGGVSNVSNRVQQDRFEVEENILSRGVGEVKQSDIEKIKKIGGLILPLSKDNNYVELTFLNNPKFSDNDALLISISPEQTLWLKLSNTQITDKSCLEIAKLTNLTRLHLENTKITDAALSSLGKLQNLEYLNLTNTSISDNGILALANLKNLKKIYLWKTKVTLLGVENLKKKIPNLSVEIGLSEQQMAELSKQKVNEKSDDVYKK